MTQLTPHRARELFWQRWAQWGAGRDERGDVPGWVMIVVMTAGLVLALSVVAGDRLQAMLATALASVGG